MQPEFLTLWQPHASMEQLQQFIHQNAHLFSLLEETWQKFDETYQANKPATQFTTAKPYAAHITPEQLEHHPISSEELAVFAQLFEQEHRRQDRPFGDNPIIQEQDWQIEE